MNKIYIISNGEKKQDSQFNYYKIGVSKSPQTRIKQLQTGNPNKLKLLFEAEIKKADAYKVEKTIHNFFKEHEGKHVYNEWFKLTDDEVVNIAKLLIESFS